MAGFIAGTHQLPVAATMNLTLPVGSVVGGWCLAIEAEGSNTAVTGAIAGSTTLLSAAANNMYIQVLAKQLTPTDIGNGFLAVTGTTSGHDWWALSYDTTVSGFDSANSFPLGSSFYGTRGGITQAFTTAPSVTPNGSNDYIIVLSWERTTGATTVSSVTQGTQDYYNEDVITSNVSTLAAHFSGAFAGVATGADTITYSNSSGNGLALILPMTFSPIIGSVSSAIHPGRGPSNRGRFYQTPRDTTIPSSTTQTITPTSIVSAEAIGTPIVTPGGVTISPTGIASAEAFGTHVVSAGPVTVAPGGIASGESFGAAVLTPSSVTILPSGIPSAEALGNAVVAPGTVTVAPSGISSTEAFGVAVVTTGPVAVSPTGIPSAEAFGGAVVVPGAVAVSPAGIPSAEALGSPSVSPGAVAVAPSGIGSTEAFGAPSVNSGAVTVAPGGIASGETVGQPTITIVPVAPLVLSPERTRVVAREARLLVPLESRTYAVVTESRVLGVA